MLEIELFGEPRFRFEGKPHAFVAPPKTLPLLVYLLLQRNAIVARETLAGLFWPECDEETARANLRRHLHYARKALPAGEWLSVDAKHVQWNGSASYRLDVAEFEQQSKVPQMRALAVKVYAGDLYRTCEEEWLYFERERLRSMQIANLAALAQDAEHAGNYSAATEYANALLELEPWREDAVRVLMRARMQSGDRAGALAQYERFRDRLADEMGVEPMDETTGLFEALARKETRAPETGASESGLVGRSGEFDALLLQWRAASSGHGAFALVGGEAGIGKTALVEALAAQVRSAGGIVLQGEVAPVNETPYAAFTQALSQAPLDARLRPPASNESAERGAFFASVAAAISAIAERSPVLLCIEDLHWAGGDDIALIEFLERRLREARVLVVATYREDAVAPEHPLRALRRSFAARTTYAHVALNPLTPEDADRIVSRRLGGTSHDVAQTLYRRTQGNAFFLTELLENIAASHVDEIPDSIRDLVEERSERLSPQARDAVLRFAVAGAAVSPELLAGLMDVDQSARKRILDELVRARFLREEAGASGSYAFNHDVVRESLYESISSDRRVALHARVAREMERISASRYAAAIADHYERANEPQPAAAAYLRAATQSLEAFASSDAERYAREAIALTTDPDLAMQAYAQLDAVYKRDADPHRRAAVAQEMESIAERTGDSMHACLAAYYRLTHAMEEDDAQSIAPLLQRFAAQIPGDFVWKARLRTFESMYEELSGNPDKAWLLAQDALALYARTGDAFGQLSSYVRLLEMSERLTRPFDALLDEARALERSLGDPDSAFLLANAEAKLFLHADRTQCRYAALRIIEAGERAGDRIYVGIGHMYLAAVATYRFEPEAAQEHFSTAEAALQDSSRRADRARLLRFRGLFHFSLGNAEQGLADSLAALDLARQVRAYDLIGYSAGNVLYGYALTHRSDLAERLAADVLAELDGVQQHYFSVHHMMLCLGMARGAQGRYDEAIPGMQRAIEEHEIRGHKLHAAWTGTSLSYLMLRAGRVGEAQPYVDGYLKLLPDMLDEGWMPQETLWQVAQVLRGLGETQRAQHLLTRAAGVVAARLSSLTQEDLQQSYVAIPINREILRAHTENVWPAY